MTVFKRWPDGVIRLHWASELVHAPRDPGQDMRHIGTVEPLWTLFDLTPNGRPNQLEEFEYDCCAPRRTVPDLGRSVAEPRSRCGASGVGSGGSFARQPL